MCKAGLFYFNKDISHGPPIRTCLSKMKQEVDDSTKPYARSAMLTGIWCLFVFIMHFGLYNRPVEDGEESPQANQETPAVKENELHELPQTERAQAPAFANMPDTERKGPVEPELQV